MLCITVLPSERPLHYQERVLPILHSFGTDSHLLIKKHIAMDAMVIYLGKHTNPLPTKLFSLNHCSASPPHHLILYNLSFCPPANKMDASKHGMMKFREERSILGLGLSSGSFHDRYFILNSNSLRMYKEVRVSLTLYKLVKSLFLSSLYFTGSFTMFLSLSVCQSNRPERDWPAKNLKIYLGIKKKLRPPTW